MTYIKFTVIRVGLPDLVVEGTPDEVKATVAGAT